MKSWIIIPFYITLRNLQLGENSVMKAQWGQIKHPKPRLHSFQGLIIIGSCRPTLNIQYDYNNNNNHMTKSRKASYTKNMRSVGYNMDFSITIDREVHGYNN